MINIEDKEDAGQFLPQVRSYNLGCPYSMDDLREDLGPKVPSCTEVPLQIMKFPKPTRKVPFFPKNGLNSSVTPGIIDTLRCGRSRRGL